jgi:hypothetical protein
MDAPRAVARRGKSRPLVPPIPAVGTLMAALSLYGGSKKAPN